MFPLENLGITHPVWYHWTREKDGIKGTSIYEALTLYQAS